MKSIDYVACYPVSFSKKNHTVLMYLYRGEITSLYSSIFSIEQIEHAATITWPAVSLLILDTDPMIGSAILSSILGIIVREVKSWLHISHNKM